MKGPLSWTSGTPVIYNIPDGLGLGTYTYTINFTDAYDHYNTDSVVFTVEDTTDPIITFSSNDVTIQVGYSDVNINWTATDAFPGTYTIELEGSGIVIGPLTWTSGDPISYDIPASLEPGVYVFTITISDDNGNSASSTVTVTVTGSPGGGAIPFDGITFLVITIISTISLIYLKKRKN